MSLRICAHARPADVAPEAFIDATVVVIDVLRATTTMATALANGAREIIPCTSIEQARERAKQLRVPGHACQARNILTGGERKGVKIEGFDLGNSPRDYTRDRVASSTIVFTTTNGTRALDHARSARCVLIGALVNRTAAARAALATELDIHLLCAGTGGEPSIDDTLTAGAIADAIMRLSEDIELDTTARRAFEAWRDTTDPGAVFRTCRAGRNLAKAGLGDDIADCLRVDALDVVGELRDGAVQALPAAARTIIA